MSIEPKPSLPNLAAVRRELAQRFEPVYGAAEARCMAQILVEDLLGLTPTEVALRLADAVSASDCERLMQAGRRIAAGEPLQYVTGSVVFAGRRFAVSPSVLIPRPETQELVAWVAAEAGGRALSVLDVGTGSGCIAVSLKAERAQLRVSGCDVSADALAVARANADAHGLPVAWFEADILSGDVPGAPYDVVVSNPPYICRREMAAMSANVVEHEPHLALFVPDSDPLLFYRVIARRCVAGLLAPGGSLFFEIKEAYGPQAARLLADTGFENVELRKDFWGKDRMLRATFRPRP